MLQTERVLIASHGTPGARAAERAALELAAPGATIFHLVVVPDFWRGMMGDDWLNNASTRAAYGRHVEAQLAREIEEHRAALEQVVRAGGRRYELKVVIGQPDAALLDYAATLRPDIAVAAMYFRVFSSLRFTSNAMSLSRRAASAAASAAS